jgi:hypothetical protein
MWIRLGKKPRAEPRLNGGASNQGVGNMTTRKKNDVPAPSGGSRFIAALRSAL